MKRISLPPQRILGAMLIILFVWSCKKNEDTNASSTPSGKISYVVKASSLGSSNKKVSTVVDSLMMDIAVNWNFATIWVEKITFVANSGRSIDTTIMITKKLNIFNGDALAGIIQLPAGSYKDVKMKMYCRKSPTSDFAFDFRGSFSSTKGGIDSIRVGSSYPFEADLSVTNVVIDPSDNYNATFSFNLNNTLTGIKTSVLERSMQYRIAENNAKLYVIWKGGSKDEPFYDQVIQNWQSVASVTLSKSGNASGQ